ncbi:MAG TPA: flagellar basal body L-ring protein FlgH [Gemmatimonadaceae bacterium]|nr:flagellar basal body L-ring protein FlgH [Gemmatimonadaceae bacterium]
MNARDLFGATVAERAFRALSILAAAAVIPAHPLPAQQTGKDQPLPPPRLVSFTSDRREFVVGDVITVTLNESTMASAAKEQDGSDQQSRQNDVSLQPPQMGASALPAMAASLGADKNAASQQSGAAQRNVTFQGDITVRVDSVDKHGVLHVKGQKVVDVDGNKQTLTFTGSIRPQDVSPTNTIESNRVADTQLAYGVSGSLGKTRGGLLSRILSSIWP